MAEERATYTPLLATKLFIPQARPGLVLRPHLVERLDESLHHPLTLVSAPAGFGKTTLVGAWARDLQTPVAWLSLDEADGDPARFLRYLVAAFQQVDPAVGQRAWGAIGSFPSPRLDVAIGTLINEVAARQADLVLVLDDLHTIAEEAIHAAIQELVVHAPPPLHLVIVTREDPPLPLARLRARGQLVELRAHDLRFTPEEADRFLRQAMGLALEAADVQELTARTEGWPAGLQLAGLSVRDRADPSRFVATLSGNQRYVLSYLSEEVLNRQPEEVQLFLLQTSILDRLNGDLCDAVTGRSDSGSLLQRLFAANLFLIPLDDEQYWYRFHQLFADLLRGRQKRRLPGQEAELHRRAGRWYARVGMAGEAMSHALAAEDYALAVDLVESHAMDLLKQWSVKTVQGWARAIPPESIRSSARANLAFAWMHLQRGDYAPAAPYLERLQAIFSQGGVPEDLRVEWLILRSMRENAHGRPEESLGLAGQALEIAPEQGAYAQSLAQMELAGAYQQVGDYARAEEAFQSVMGHGRATGDQIMELSGASGLALLAIQRGQLHSAFEIASQSLERVERSGPPLPIAAALYGELGVVHFQWHQLEQARHYFLRAAEVSAASSYSDAAVFQGVILSGLLQMEGDLPGAARELQKAVDRMQVDAPAQVREEVITQQVRLFLAQGRLAAAEKALRGFSGRDSLAALDVAPGQKITYPAGVLYNSALRILLHRGRERRERPALRRGIELADRLLTAALQAQYLPVALETLLLRAQAHAALGDETASLADYARALELAEPEGFISPFVEAGPAAAAALRKLVEQKRLGPLRPAYVDALLAALARARPAAMAGQGEPLTGRELEVLRWMAAGLTYREVAGRLVVSLNTVRSHVKAIYGKLGVNNRTQAIEVARQRHLW